MQENKVSRLIELSKELAEISKELIIGVDEGLEDPIIIARNFRNMGKFFEGCYEKVKDPLRNELDKMSPDDLASMGITYQNGGKRYDYSGVQEITELETRIKKLKEIGKAATAAGEPISYEAIDSETGEVVTRTIMPLPTKVNNKSIKL